MTDFDFLSYTVELDRPQESQDMVGIKIKMPKACVYENEKGETEYCPICNHDDVPYCQYLDDDEVGVGVDERPCYCPLVEIKEHTPERTETQGITDEQAIEHLQSTGWMQNHDRELYESGFRECLADSGSYDSLISERHDKRTETHGCDYGEKETHGDLVSRSYLLSEYDRQHKGPAGGARKIIEEAPSAEPEIIRCCKCVHWQQDTVRQNSNDVSWWNEAVCGRYSDDIWTAWKDADWYCADAERRTDETD